MKIFGDNDSKKDPTLITSWFLVHLLSGIILMYIFYIYFNIDIWIATLIVLGLHTLYEIKDLFINPLFYPDTNIKKNHSILNSIGDTIGCIIGILIVIFFIKNKNNTLFLSLVIVYFGLQVLFTNLNIN